MVFMALRHSSIFVLSSFFIAALACSSNGTQPAPDAGSDAGLPIEGTSQVPAGFERFCANRDPTVTTPSTVSSLSGNYVGYYSKGQNAAGQAVAIATNTMEMMKVIPPEPFYVDTIRVAFASGSGTAKLRLQNTFGRSYPASFQASDPDDPHPSDFPEYDPNAIDIVPPIEVTVTDATPDQWIDVDVSAAHAALLPTQHYMIVYEHETPAPYLAIETVPTNEYSRATMLYPDQSGDYGVAIDANGTPGHFRLELVGRTFCEWNEPDHWFGDGTPATFTTGNQYGATEIADINGDGHDDLMVSDVLANDGPHPRAYFGDGKGNFTAASYDALALASEASMLVFGDFDNDGDQDVFGAVYVYPDQDGDGYTIQDGDCNDLDATIHPGATETANGKDDDCDGVADNGTSGANSTADADQDGFTIAQGDCDDTNPAAHPGATELLDAKDNNCNGKADEIFHHMLLLNDGTGHFTVKPSSGLEFSEPASEVAIGDANGDGKLDIYWGNWLIHYPDAPAVPSHFVEGNGDATFNDVMTQVGMVIPTAHPVYGVTFNDFNNDGLQDIYVGDYQLNDNLMWQNMGGNQFTNTAPALHIDHDTIPTQDIGYPGGHSYGSDFADIDNDGDIDFWLSNLSHPRTQPWADPSLLYVNEGTATAPNFLDKRHAYGIVYDEGDINGYFGDFDNDMDLDLVIGSLYTGHYDKLYRNDGDHFTDVTYEANVAVHQGQNVAWADVNEDGSLDLIVHGSDVPQVHVFLNRNVSQNNWVEMRLQGTTSNRDAIGARVTLTAGGVTQMRDVRGTCGGGIAAGLCSRVVHFGLAKNQTIDQVKVRWVYGTTPNGAPEETISGLAPNGIYSIVQGTGTATRVK